MDVGQMIKQAHSGISQQLQNVEEKISKLERARQNIEKEQRISASDIKQILKPELGAHWTGRRAEAFFDERDSAHTAMYHVVHDDYENYIDSIQLQISRLKAEKAGLLVEQADVVGTQELFEKGGATVHLIEHKVEQFKKWIF
ncbi:DUF5082 family protein [Bacillus sp. HSf4]|uniref:YwqH-like family protein n=1 Tax=Bacillus sp. HSf4 TaxID=3035514 RepID=UPI00240A824B|nr:DUF5082 family protein [Bacillus sp. HSf4]WFA05745.1 DUF5082 family protein [Bacillus sp. HSf4]